MQKMAESRVTQDDAQVLRGPRSRLESEARATLTLAFGLAVLLHAGMVVAAYVLPAEPPPEKRKENRERVIEALRVEGVQREEPEHVPRAEPPPYVPRAEPQVVAAVEPLPPPAGEAGTGAAGGRPMDLSLVPPPEPAQPHSVQLDLSPARRPEPPVEVQAPQEPPPELFVGPLLEEAPAVPVFIPKPDPTLPRPEPEPPKPEKARMASKAKPERATVKGIAKPKHGGREHQILATLSASSPESQIASSLMLNSLTSTGGADLADLIGSGALGDAAPSGGFGAARAGEGAGLIGRGNGAAMGLIGSKRGGGGMGSIGYTDDALIKHYIRRLSGALRKKLAYPKEAARRGIEGTVTLELVIDADGRVVERRLARSSGHEVLDRAALAMVEEMETVPKPPDALDWTTRAVRVPLQYRLAR